MILIVPMLTTMFLQGREGTVVFEIGTTFSFIVNNLFDCYIQIFQQNSYQASEAPPAESKKADTRKKVT